MKITKITITVMPLLLFSLNIISNNWITELRTQNSDSQLAGGGLTEQLPTALPLLHVEPPGVGQHPPGELNDSLTQFGGGLPAQALQELPRYGVPGDHTQT